MIEVTICTFINRNKSNWASLLPYLAFAYNNTPHTTMKYALAYLLYGFHLCAPFNLITMESAIEQLNHYDFNAPDVQQFINNISSIQLIVKDALKLTQEHFKNSYNSNHIPITFKPGDWVLINIHLLNLPELKGKGLKFTRWFDRPFEITELVGLVMYWIQLPHSYGIHPVLSITHLKPFKSDDQNDWLDLKSLCKNPEEYEVEEIVEQWQVKIHNWNQPMYNVDGRTMELQMNGYQNLTYAMQREFLMLGNLSLRNKNCESRTTNFILGR